MLQAVSERAPQVGADAGRVLPAGAAGERERQVAAGEELARQAEAAGELGQLAEAFVARAELVGVEQVSVPEERAQASSEPEREVGVFLVPVPASTAALSWVSGPRNETRTGFRSVRRTPRPCCSQSPSTKRT